MFKMIFSILQSFFTIIGYLVIFMVIIVLFGEELKGIFLSMFLGLIVVALLFSGMHFDRQMRKKYNLTHKQMFSVLWTALSIIELCLFSVFAIIISCGLISVSVLIYDILIYLLLSTLILYRKIKKINNKKRW